MCTVLLLIKILLRMLNQMLQALNRAGGKAGNKGAETALTAVSKPSVGNLNFKQTFKYCHVTSSSSLQIEMASLFRHHLG
jgi:hypothetical protein